MRQIQKTQLLTLLPSDYSLEIIPTLDHQYMIVCFFFLLRKRFAERPICNAV